MTKKRPDGYVPLPPGRPAKYPWKKWFDGERHFIQPGSDFNCSIESMRQQLYARAKRADRKLEVRRYGTGLTIQASEVGTASTAKYNWDDLLNGDTHVLLAGAHFTSSPESFRQYARKKAQERGAKLESRLVGGTLTIRAVLPKAPDNPLGNLPFEIEEN